ncbi:glycosyltransferase [Brachyspira aalborgi]|uniref:Glycosyltransferase n=1 Tax=Brachyspira aalborgi TaxID=29522 RepID=A0A5C8D4T2_9SPIR|nr:glycosyltransferase family 2 protein [Brachyspira aalborgi]TXJ20405.1 glycosyltransferase [Brachyspira aalborgi]
MKIAAIIPCYNEELTIKQVICDIQKYCPKCEIYVFDNNSSDNSYNIAKETGAIVNKVSYQGKGEVIRRAFADIDSDIYIMVDADMQYDLSEINNFINYFTENKLDMLNISREVVDETVHRKGHSFGNMMLTGFANFLFGKKFNDMLSGYRIFSKRFVKSFPANSRGFEIETELTIYALQMRLPIDEVSAKYIKRPEGSHSKLNTFKDGFRILFTIIYLLITEKPLLFFNTISLIFLVIGLFLGIGITIEYFETLKVERFPTAILTICLIILSALSFSIGLLMKAISKVLSENRRFKYNSVK